MPWVKPAILAWTVASTFATASFMAANTRSSSMSLSSPSRLGSIDTFFTACLQLIVTFTRPAPAWPSTSMCASSSCTRFMFSCICCACFIRAPRPPFIMVSPLLFGVGAVLGRTDGAGDHLGAEVLHEIAHEGILLDRLGGFRLLLRHL